MGKAILRGILWTSLGTLPAAFIVAILYRFPIPFRGFIRGWDLFSEGPDTSMELLWLLLQAAFYYTVWGGFIPLAVLGTIAGLAGGGWASPIELAGTRQHRPGSGLVTAMVLSVLDKIIGKW